MQKREIKFRGWDKANKRMLAPQDLSQSGGYWEWLGKEDVELLEFTGLRDADGKEVYEGDVVEYVPDPIGNPKDRDVFVVEYVRSGFCFVKPGDGDHWITYLQESKIRVIGSVFENPELTNK